jgi:hypothetical protein
VRAVTNLECPHSLHFSWFFGLRLRNAVWQLAQSGFFFFVRDFTALSFLHLLHFSRFGTYFFGARILSANFANNQEFPFLMYSSRWVAVILRTLLAQ